MDANVTQLALIHDGRIYISLGRNVYGEPRVYAEDGSYATLEEAHERNWYAGDWGSIEPPVSVEVVHPPRRTTEGWKLSDEFEHLAGEKYPAEMKVAEFERRAGDWEDPIDPSLRKMYEPMHGEEPVEPTVFDGPFVLLDGEPAPSDGFTYMAKLPYELQYHNEYVHLFPGYLVGFVQAVKERFESLQGLDVDFYTHGSSPSVFVKHERGGPIVFHDDSYRVPNRIEGVNRADAKEKWAEALDKAEADLRARVKVCPTCGGTGKPKEAAKPRRKRGR